MVFLDRQTMFKSSARLIRRYLSRPAWCCGHWQDCRQAMVVVYVELLPGDFDVPPLSAIPDVADEPWTARCSPFPHWSGSADWHRAGLVDARQEVRAHRTCCSLIHPKLLLGPLGCLLPRRKVRDHCLLTGGVGDPDPEAAVTVPLDMVIVVHAEP
jgi:hypothetical protein